MRFVLIDRITEINPGQSLTAVKNLSLAEEYLADHFPGFPVMPGVLMLEALTQAALSGEACALLTGDPAPWRSRLDARGVEAEILA